MSRSSKILTLLIGLLILTVVSIPVFAQDTATGEAVKKDSVQLKRIDARKEKIEDRITNMQEKQASKTAVLRDKLLKFKNKEKATVAERINNNLNLVNQKQTTQMQKHLITMMGILEKLEVRVNQGSPDIKDPALAKSAITSARQAWATASAAIATQVQKDYTVQITSESRIRTDVKTQRDKLHTDLQTLRKTIIEAKQAISDAIRTAKSGKSSTEDEEGTPSGQ